MKRIIATAFFLSAVSLSGIAAPAVAAPYDSRPHQTERHQNSGPDWKKPQQHKPQYSYDGRRYDAFRGQAWKAPKGYSNHRNFHRGQKLPSAYRNKAYVVDYRAYRLQRPPKGYEWVRVSNSVFLVSQGNGLISQIVLNLFY